MNKFLALALAGALLLGCTEVANVPAKPASVQKAEKPKTAVLINGLLVYSKPGMMGAIKAEFERLGWTVIVLNHTDAKRMTAMPRVVVTHSKGGNSFLKRAQYFKKNPPDLIVTIDPGRLPQFSNAPGTAARVVNIRCWYHPIGGQEIYGADKDYASVCGTDHLVMPHDKRVLDIIFAEVEALK
jgi:hypothetical protein